MIHLNYQDRRYYHHLCNNELDKSNDNVNMKGYDSLDLQEFSKVTCPDCLDQHESDLIKMWIDNSLILSKAYSKFITLQNGLIVKMKNAGNKLTLDNNLKI